MTYNVFGGTLNLTQSINQSICCNLGWLDCLPFSTHIMSTTSVCMTQEMQMMKLSKTSGLTKLQQRGNRSSVTSCTPPLPAPSSSSSSSSPSPAATDLTSVPDTLSIVESRVCRELMVDKFNRVSTSQLHHSHIHCSMSCNISLISFAFSNVLQHS